MASVSFSSFIQHHVACPALDAFGNSVKEVMDCYFEKQPQVRGYILDEHGCLRPRLAMYVDGEPVVDRIQLTDPVHLDAKVLIMTVPFDTEYEEVH